MDDRPVYSDTGYFTRGRTGYRPEPKINEKRDFWWGLLGLMALSAILCTTIALTR
jgi:hypothetical protein